MVRPVDMQQMIQATSQAGRLQQQQAHGAAVEQSKLVQQQRLKEEQRQQDVCETPASEDAGLEHVPRREKERLQRRGGRRSVRVADVRQVQGRQPETPAADEDEAGPYAGGRFVDIDA
jgi:hypothetical protein